MIFIWYSRCKSLDYNIYYVATNGNNTTGDGSITKPFATIGKAWEYVTPNDRIYIRGGTYYLTAGTTISLVGKSGTAGKLIKIWNFPGETVIFDGTNIGAVHYMSLFSIGNATPMGYIHIKGLKFTTLLQDSAMNYGVLGRNIANSIFENIETSYIGGRGFQLWDNGTTNNLVLNCDSHHNSDPNGANPYENSDGFSIAPALGVNTVNTFRGCRAWMNCDDGYDFFQNEGVIIMEDCQAFWNGYVPEEDVPVNYTTAGNGNGFKLGESAILELNVVKKFLRNCISVKNRTMGYSQNNASSALSIINSCDYDSYACIHTRVGNYAHIFKNNWLYSSNNNIQSSTGKTDTNNSWNLGITINPATDFVSVDYTLLLTARAANGSLQETNLFKLTPTSQLLNVGVDVDLPYSGSAPDLGAFELVA